MLATEHTIREHWSSVTTTPLSFIVRLNAKPDCGTLREVFENCVSPTCAEPGNVSYDLR